MGMSVRRIAVVVGALASIFACSACSSEAVQKAAGCSDPCCAGDSTHVDCAEHPSLSCTESGDPCTARSYGCVNGTFYLKAPASPPATCTAAEGGEDAPSDAAASDEGTLSDGSVASFACGDASCDVASQYCRHTAGGAPPGVDTLGCQPLGEGQAICAPDAPNGGCQCTGDAGALYVQCDVP